MAFDYKKEYKEFYMPKNKPSIVEIPKINYIAVRGTGNPNEENGDYKNTIGLLYGIAYTIKMSYKGTHKIDGFFEYVVPPLEGFWWQDGLKGSIDEAVIHRALKSDLSNLVNEFKKVDEIPFDYTRKRMSVVVKSEDGYRMLTKGAIEEILKCCKQVKYKDEIIPITDDLIKQIEVNCRQKLLIWLMTAGS